MYFDCPTHEFNSASFHILPSYLLAHVVVEILVKVIHSLLVILCESVRQRSQQMLHMKVFISFCISCDNFYALELLFVFSMRWFILNILRFLLYPLLEQHRGEWILIRLALNEKSHSFFQLRQVFKHHLLETQMASVQEDWNQTSVQSDSVFGLTRSIRSELNQDFFSCFIEEFVELIHMYLTILGVLVVGFQIELLLCEFILMDKKTNAWI